MKFDYENTHSAVWENHKVTWIASNLFIPIIFAVEAYFLQQYFDKFSDSTSTKQLFIFIFGALLIQCVAIIWYLVMSAFHDLNEKRIKRLKEIEDNLDYKDPIRKIHLVNQYKYLTQNRKEDESKEISKRNSQDLQADGSNNHTLTVSADIIVNQVNATVTWKPTDTINYGTPLCAAQLNAEAKDPTTETSVPGNFIYKEGENSIDKGTILSIGKHRLDATFTPTNSNCSILSRLLASLCRRLSPLCRRLSPLSRMLVSLLSVFFLLFYVPLMMPLVLMKRYKIVEDCLKENKKWHVMKIYLLVVLLLYSLNLVTFVCLSVLMIFGVKFGVAPHQNNEFLNFTINCVNLAVNITK